MANLNLYNLINFQKLILKPYNLRTISFLSKEKKDPELKEESDKEETVAILIDDEEDLELKEREIENKRNVSRLLPQHRNILNGKLPYAESQSWVHETLKYKRMMYGRYGEESNVNPAICFPNKHELEDRREYEKVAFPHTLKEMIAINKKEKQMQKEAIELREIQIGKKLEKLGQWEKELKDKILKKELDAKAAKERKERIVEEVRRQFGFKVDPRDERFKEMLEQKEKEDKKKLKEEKRKLKEAKFISKLANKNEVVDSKPVEN